jgi:hypothetical protein
MTPLKTLVSAIFRKFGNCFGLFEIRVSKSMLPECVLFSSRYNNQFVCLSLFVCVSLLLSIILVSRFLSIRDSSENCHVLFCHDLFHLCWIRRRYNYCSGRVASWHSFVCLSLYMCVSVLLSIILVFPRFLSIRSKGRTDERMNEPTDSYS